MNKLIKEFAEQAGYKPLPGFDFANSLEETYLKKFAELIVRECAEFAGCNGHVSGFTLGDLIKEHFGVES